MSVSLAKLFAWLSTIVILVFMPVCFALDSTNVAQISAPLNNNQNLCVFLSINSYTCLQLCNALDVT